GGKATENLGQLTRQELQILSLVSQGLNNKEISRRLYISLKTVKNHLTHLFAKLGVANRRQATLAFLARGEEGNEGAAPGEFSGRRQRRKSRPTLCAGPRAGWSSPWRRRPAARRETFWV